MTPKILAGVAALGTSCVLAAPAFAASAPAKHYVASWQSAYQTFARVYVKAYRPCLKGATKSCADAQGLAAASAAKLASILKASPPPPELAKDITILKRDLMAASRTLSASAAAARAGRTSQRVWCSAEQGPCTPVMIDLGNVIGDINFTAGVDLPLPA